jgi:hypothetical protein
LAWRNREGHAARSVARGALVLAGLAIVSAAALGWAVARGAANAGTLQAMTEDRRSLWTVWPTFLILLLAVAAFAALAYAKRHAGYAVAAFAIFPLALVTVALPAVQGFARGRSAKPLAEGLASLPVGTELACLDGYPAGLSFYLGRTLTMISEDAKPLRSNFIMYWLRQVPVRPPSIVAPSAREEWLASRRTAAFIVAPDGSRADLDAWLGPRAAVRAVAAGWWGAMVPPQAER